MGGVKGTKYLLKIRNHAARTTRHASLKAENSVPPLFFEKAGDKKKQKPLDLVGSIHRRCTFYIPVLLNEGLQVTSD